MGAYRNLFKDSDNSIPEHVNFFKLNFFKIKNIQFKNCETITMGKNLIVDGRNIGASSISYFVNSVFVIGINITNTQTETIPISINEHQFNVGATPKKYSNIIISGSQEKIRVYLNGKEIIFKDSKDNPINIKSEQSNKIVFFDGDYSFVAINPVAFELPLELLETAKQYCSLFFHEISKRRNGMNGNVGVVGSDVILGGFNKFVFKNTKKRALLNFNNTVEIYNMSHIDGMGKVYYPFTFVAANKDNYISIKTTNKTDLQIIAHNNNHIEGQRCNEYCIFGDNNFIKNPNFDFNGKIYLTDEKSPFAIETVITESSQAGDNYIVVENTDHLLAGHRIKFATKKAAFAWRDIVAVIGNKVFFEKPLSDKEETYVNGYVFCDLPQERKEFQTVIAVDSKPYSRRFYIQDIPDFSLYMRKITIGSFESIVNYLDDEKHLLIVNDISDNMIPKGTQVTVPEYKFIESVTFTIGETLPNIYIGQKITVNDNQCTVAGFDKRNNAVMFAETSDDLNGQSATTEPIDKEQLFSTSKFKELTYLKFKKYDKYIPLSTGNDVEVGGLLFIDGKYYQIEEVHLFDDRILVKTNKSLEELILNDKIIYNGKVVDRKISINDINNNYAEYMNIYNAKDI